MPPKPRKKDDDPDYVPGEETDDTEEEAEENVEETTTKSPKKSAKSKKSGRKKGDDEYKPSDPENDDDEEYVETTETGQSSSPKGRKKTKKSTEKQSSPPDDDDNNDKSAPKNPVKKVVNVLKEKKEGLLDEVRPKFGKKKSDETDFEESNEIDQLLASFPLPSSSKKVVFNPNIALIGAINIQAFGTKKSSNNVIMRIISDILRHYDIILCQEIRANDDIIKKLCDSVSTPATPFSYVASHPIGRSSYKEKYVFLYRKNEWKVLEDYVIDDDVKLGDKFIREPYVVRFQHLKKSNVRVTLVGCHTQPDEAFAEIKVLVTTVYTDVRKKLQRDIVQEKRQLDRGIGTKEKERNHFLSLLLNYVCCCFGSYSRVSTRDFSEELATTVADTDEPIIMMGDFNASGSYVNKSQRAELDTLLKKNNLIWGIKHNTDTTVADGPDTAYDRFIFEAANERRWIGNTSIWRFDDGWIKNDADNASVKKAAKRVTDHYPIEFEFKLS